MLEISFYRRHDITIIFIVYAMQTLGGVIGEKETTTSHAE